MPIIGPWRTPSTLPPLLPGVNKNNIVTKYKADRFLSLVFCPSNRQILANQLLNKQCELRPLHPAKRFAEHPFAGAGGILCCLVARCATGERRRLHLGR